MTLNITNAAIDTFAHDSASFGAGTATNGAAIRKADNEIIVLAVENTSDQAVTYTFEASNDSTFTSKWTLPGSIVLAAGNVTTQSGFRTLSDPWPYVRVVHTPAGNPTAGNSKSWVFGN